MTQVQPANRVMSPYRASATVAQPGGTVANQPLDASTLSAECANPSASPARHRLARGVLLSAVATASMLSMVACNEVPTTPPASTAANNNTVMARVSIELNENSVLTKSPNGAHSLAANDSSVVLDGQHVKDAKGAEITLTENSSSKIAAAVNDSGQYVILSDHGIFMNGQWVAAISHTDATLGTAAVALNNSGHWVAASYDGTVVDGKWVTDGSNKRLPVNKEDDSSTAPWVSMSEEGNWDAGGSARITAGQVEAPNSSRNTMARVSIELNENTALAKSPNGAHSLAASDKSVVVDGSRVTDEKGGDITLTESTSSKIAAAINNNGQYIIFSDHGVFMNGQWVAAIRHADDSSTFVSGSVAINNSGHWMAANAEDGVVVDGKWVTDGSGNRLHTDKEYDVSTPTWATMGDDGNWDAGGSARIVAGHVDVPN